MYRLESKNVNGWRQCHHETHPSFWPEDPDNLVSLWGGCRRGFIRLALPISALHTHHNLDIILSSNRQRILSLTRRAHGPCNKAFTHDRSNPSPFQNPEPIPVGVIGAASLDTDSAQKPERTRST